MPRHRHQLGRSDRDPGHEEGILGPVQEASAAAGRQAAHRPDVRQDQHRPSRNRGRHRRHPEGIAVHQAQADSCAAALREAQSLHQSRQLAVLPGREDQGLGTGARRSGSSVPAPRRHQLVRFRRRQCARRTRGIYRAADRLCRASDRPQSDRAVRQDRRPPARERRAPARASRRRSGRGHACRCRLHPAGRPRPDARAHGADRGFRAGPHRAPAALHAGRCRRRGRQPGQRPPQGRHRHDHRRRHRTTSARARSRLTAGHLAQGTGARLEGAVHRLRHAPLRAADLRLRARTLLVQHQSRGAESAVGHAGRPASAAASQRLGVRAAVVRIGQ